LRLPENAHKKSRTGLLLQADPAALLITRARDSNPEFQLGEQYQPSSNSG